MQSITAVVESFRRKGLKITPQRRFIFRTLTGDHNHPSAEDVYQHVVSALPDTSRTTVYNTLHELVRLGELVEIDLGDGRTRYDTNTSVHQHLHCVSCHALVDIYREIEGLELFPDETAGYRIVGCRLIFDGYCPNCQVE
jgi:Fe2+ or Zn2+ uptake regulation protein